MKLHCFAQWTDVTVICNVVISLSLDSSLNLQSLVLQPQFQKSWDAV